MLFYLLEYAILKAEIHIEGILQKIREMRPIADQNFCCTKLCLTEMLNKFMIGFHNLRILKNMPHRAPFHHIHMSGWSNELLKSENFIKPLLSLFDAFLHKTKESGKKASPFALWSEIKLMQLENLLQKQNKIYNYTVSYRFRLVSIFHAMQKGAQLL